MSKTDKPKTAVAGEFYGISREDEERKLEHICKLAQGRLTRSQEQVYKLQSELRELQEVYDLDEHEGQALWNNTDARLQEVQQNLAKVERAQKKPYVKACSGSADRPDSLGLFGL